MRQVFYVVMLSTCKLANGFSISSWHLKWAGTWSQRVKLMQVMMKDFLSQCIFSLCLMLLLGSDIIWIVQMRSVSRSFLFTLSVITKFLISKHQCDRCQFPLLLKYRLLLFQGNLLSLRVQLRELVILYVQLLLSLQLQVPVPLRV